MNTKNRDEMALEILKTLLVSEQEWKNTRTTSDYAELAYELADRMIKKGNVNVES